MEFLVSIVTEVGKCLWFPIERRINYLVYYKTNIENLRSQVTNLETRKKDIQNRIDESLRNLEEPTEEVQWWLERANEIEFATRNVGREESENRKWLKGLCPDWSSRYRASKTAVNKVDIVKEHLEKGNFSKVSRVLPPPSVVPMPSDYVEGLKPIEHALHQLVEALWDERIRAIGVHGMAGVGKTTLMKRLNNELERNQSFEKVIFVVVSSNPNLEKIQDEMAERLGFKFEDQERSLLVRANKLSMGLRLKKTVLIILDDVWKRLDLFAIGIPGETDHRGLKIVVTSRMESVCFQMGTQSNIKLEPLSYDESWILFKEKAGNVVDFPTLQPIAKLVMSECKGLPLAIVTVGLSLRMNRDSILWRNALRKLQNSILNEQEDYVFSSLRLSYDFLKGEDVKLCFLFCSLFPEDENIDLKYLLWYGVGEGFLKVGKILEDTLDEVHDIVSRLKDCGLLLVGDHGNKEVKMHDVVRDMAIKVSMGDEHGFLVNARLGLEEWPECKSMREYKRISLVGNKITMVPAEPKCPNLQTLLLQENRDLEDIPDNFFKWMPSLLVLDLSYTGIVSLPLSLSCLTDLKTLRLEWCVNLKDVSLLGGLVTLEILCLSGCSSIFELPNAICELTNLKLLDLTGTNHLGRIPLGVISKLTHLEILNVRNSFSRWECDVGGENDGHDGALARFTELASLHRLTSLEVDLDNEKCLFEEMSVGLWKKLNRFHLTLGRGPSRHGRPPVHHFVNYDEALRKMSFAMLSPSLKNWIRVLLKRTQALCLLGCKDVNSIEQLDCLFDNDCLEFLRLQDCEEMKYLINFEKMVSSQSSLPPQGIIAVANNLKELYLMNMPKLEKLCHGLPSHQLGFFGNLRVLKVLFCRRLEKAVFSYSFLRGRMQNLEHLEVKFCDKLQNVFHYQEKEEEGQHGCDHELLLRILPKLRKLNLRQLPGLINIWGGGRGIPMPIGSLNNLKQVGVVRCDRLKNVFKLRNIFAVLGGLQQLDSLTVFGCKVMKELIIMADEDEDEDEKVKEEEEMEIMRKMSNLFPRLRVLKLLNLPELTCLYSREGQGGGGEQGNIVFDFPSLEIIEISCCPKLKSLHLGSHSAPNLTLFNCSSKEWLQGLELDDEGIRSKLQSKARFEKPPYF